MKPLFSAILETLVLVVSIGIVMLCAKLFHFESDYSNYSEKYPDSVITASNVLGYVPDGTVLTPEETAVEVGQKLFPNHNVRLPLPIAKLLCKEISESMAKVLELNPFIVFLESILCLIFGIGLPCSLYRHIDPAKSIDNFFVNKNYVYEDETGVEHGYVGETRAGIVKILLLLLMLLIANIWCFFIPLFIIVNFIVGIVMAVLRIVGIKASDANAKAEISSAAGKSGKDTYRIIVDNGMFMVSGDVHPNRGLYFNQYWNAVIARRIMECDRDGRTYSDDDARDTITYGDEDLRKRFETNRRMNRAKIKSAAAKKIAAETENEVNNMSYTFSNVSRGAVKGEFIIMSNCSDKYMMFRIAANCSFMLYLMSYDAKDRQFDAIEWSRWERMDFYARQALLDSFDGRVDPPKGEERNAVAEQITS